MSTMSPKAGLIAGLAELARSSAGLLVSRVELAALELSEARNHALGLLAMCATAFICAWFAIAFGSVLLVVLAWPAMGWTILLLVFMAFLAMALVLAAKVRAMLQEGRLSMPETMNELKHDRDMLL